MIVANGEGCKCNGRGYQEQERCDGTGVAGWWVLVPVASQPVAKETLGTG